jgi:hypothetical protein
MLKGGVTGRWEKMGGAARLEVHEEDSTAAYTPPHQRHSDSRCVATDSVATVVVRHVLFEFTLAINLASLLCASQVRDDDL